MSTSKVTTRRSRHQPYERRCRLESKVACPPIQPSLSTPSSTASARRAAPSSASPAISATKRPIREFYMAHIRQRYPGFTPRHDFDILALGDGRYTGPEKDVYAWLDHELAIQVAISGDARPALEGATRLLRSRGVVTGWKPSPGDAGVFIRPIPGSSYSLRLFPGSPSMKEYCLDFVKTASGLPVNSPFEFELWSVGTPSNPHAVRLRSLERSWGYAQKDIPSGTEKFVLRDGMTCILKRPGHKAVRFTVPTRLAAKSDTSEVDDIDFPLHTA